MAGKIGEYILFGGLGLWAAGSVLWNAFYPTEKIPTILRKSETYRVPHGGISCSPSSTVRVWGTTKKDAVSFYVSMDAGDFGPEITPGGGMLLTVRRSYPLGLSGEDISGKRVDVLKAERVWLID